MEPKTTKAKANSPLHIATKKKRSKKSSRSPPKSQITIKNLSDSEGSSFVDSHASSSPGGSKIR